jgi:hypothetical protein
VHFYFGWGNRKLNIIHSRLRNMCSSLNADLHLVNLKPSAACICGHGVEYCIHFLFECAFLNENFKQTKNNIDWSEYASTLVKAQGASNKRINSREDFNVLIRSQIIITS